MPHTCRCRSEFVYNCNIPEGLQQNKIVSWLCAVSEHDVADNSPRRAVNIQGNQGDKNGCPVVITHRGSSPESCGISRPLQASHLLLIWHLFNASTPSIQLCFSWDILFALIFHSVVTYVIHSLIHNKHNWNTQVWKLCLLVSTTLVGNEDVKTRDFTR